jgi:anti-sigma regulatory factor (Ser/Thr protein kinase)
VTGARTFRCQPESVTAARRFVREVLWDQPREIVDAAELMACELATNCIRHAHTDFELAIHTQDQIRIEVRDAAHGLPMLRSPTPQQPSGRGLQIIQAMSHKWGIVPAANGKTVWFTLPVGPAPAPTNSAGEPAGLRRGAASR